MVLAPVIGYGANAQVERQRDRGRAIGDASRRREPTMKGNVGDEILVEGRTLGDPRRTGEVLEVLDTGGVTHYRIRWDDGTDCLFYPSSDTQFLRTVSRKSRK
jgi:hypothetical protein